jgi:hypothetical protein
MPDRTPTFALVLVMLVIAGLAWRPAPGANIPPPMALSDAAPWMADALPGVGPKSRDQVAKQLQQGSIKDIPARARAMVGHLFIQLPTDQHRIPVPSSTATPVH